MNLKLLPLLTAFAVIGCYVLIGIALAERNLLLGITAFVSSVLIMRFGLKKRKKRLTSEK